MADLHPEIRPLLDGLEASPLADLALRLRDLLDVDEARRAVGSRGRAPQPESARARARRQLAVIDGAVTSWLDRELAMVSQVRRDAEALGVRQVIILPPGDEAGGPLGGRVDRLTDDARGAAIRVFRTRWSRAVEQVRLRAVGPG